MRDFGLMMSGIGLMLALTGCDMAGADSESQTVNSGLTAANLSTTSSVSASAGIANRSGAQQQRDCLHCAP